MAVTRVWRSEWAAPAGLMGLLAAAVALRGEFPAPYALTGAAVVLALGGLAVWRAPRAVTAAAVAWAVLLGWYGVAATGAGDVNQAVIGLLELGAGAAWYALGRRAFAGPRLAAWAAGVAGLAALAALGGLAALTWPHGVFAAWVDPSSGRLAGPVEYTNAMGILAVMGAVAAWTAAADGPWAAWRGWPIAGALSVAALLWSESIGATLVFVLATAVWLGRAPRTAPTVVGSVLAGLLAYGLARHPAGHPGLACLAVGVAGLAPVAAAGCARAGVWLRRQDRRVLVAAGVLVGLALAGGVADPGLRAHLARALPAALAARWAGLQASGWYDVRSRLAMWVTGWRLVAAHPLRGLGAGGWASAYLAARPWPYTASVPHSSVVQVATDAGLPALGAWLALWGAAARQWARQRSLTADGVALVLAALLAHSLMDWDLAIPGLAAVAWGGLGALAGPAPAARRSVAPLALAALGALAAGALAVGQWAGAAGDALLAQGRALSAQAAYTTALQWDPLSAAFRYDQAEIAQQLGVIDPSATATAAADYQAAVRLDPAAYLYHARDAQFLAQLGDGAEARVQLADALRDAPDVGPLYALAAGLDTGLGYEALAAHHRAAARSWLQDALQAARAFRAVRAAVNRVAPAPARLGPEPAVALYAAEAAALLREPGTASGWLAQDPRPSATRTVVAALVAWERGHPGTATRLLRGTPALQRAVRQAEALLDP